MQNGKKKGEITGGLLVCFFGLLDGLLAYCCVFWRRRRRRRRRRGDKKRKTISMLRKLSREASLSADLICSQTHVTSRNQGPLRGGKREDPGKEVRTRLL